MSTAIAIHLCAATLALVLGVVLLARAKGAPAHRLLGRAGAAPFALLPGRLLGSALARLLGMG